MSDNGNERRSGRVITMYIPIFKDKLARLERRGFGQSKEALKLRATISYVESHARLQATEDGHPIPTAAN